MAKNKEIARTALQSMDLTSLNETDTDDEIRDLCRKAVVDNASGLTTAAVCIFPAFIPLAKDMLSTTAPHSVLVATVTNFPHGNDNIEKAVSETREAVELGADEVDVVFPYQAWMERGDDKLAHALVHECKKACGNKTLKVILETGVLQSPELIQRASEIAISAGADFLKTSTGKVGINATPEAARIMLQVIRDYTMDLPQQRIIGFKAAGGIRTVEDASMYMQIADEIMGTGWSADPRHFRIGASGLLSNLLKELGHCDESSSSHPNNQETY